MKNIRRLHAPFIGLCAVMIILSIFVVPSLVTAQQVRLPATFHKQEHTLSCEIATLKMALGVHRIDIPESELISKLSFDPTPKGNGTWGDPNKGFVGNIDGQMLRDGYGVYWDPIAAVGDTYADANVLQHSSPQEIAREISKGNPVIVWGYDGARKVYSWTSSDGTPIKAVNNEHTRLVYGFDGSIKSPTRFYLIDPATGPMSWSTEEFMYNWSALNHMAVVVAPKNQWVRTSDSPQVWEINILDKTRRWITSWDIFEDRGGSTDKIEDISAQKLETFTVKPPIQ